jgi:hypothetical protein
MSMTIILRKAAVAANGLAIPVLNNKFFKGGVEGFVDFLHVGGFAYAGSLASFVPGYIYLKATLHDIPRAHDQYNEDLIHCAAPVAAQP